MATRGIPTALGPGQVGSDANVCQSQEMGWLGALVGSRRRQGILQNDISLQPFSNDFDFKVSSGNLFPREYYAEAFFK